MGCFVLGDVLGNLSQFDVEDVAYIHEDMDIHLVGPNTDILVMRYDSSEPTFRPKGMKYFLEISVMREVLEGLEFQIRRKASINEMVASVRHYAQYDAYIDPAELSEN